MERISDNYKNWECKKKAFSKTGAKLWNEIPCSLRELPKKSFKLRIKNMPPSILEEYLTKNLESSQSNRVSRAILSSCLGPANGQECETSLLGLVSICLIFENLRWLWTLSPEFFFNFAKSCLSQFDNTKLGSPNSIISYKHVKLKFRVFLARHIAAMVTYCFTKLTATCSLMIGQFFDSMILSSTDIEWI